MKIAPTLEGGIRIDAQSPEDWQYLRAIIQDANDWETDLATRLGSLVNDETIAEDWQDIVVPDLREAFTDALHHVYAAIEAAAAFPDSDESPIWITRDDADTWYCALNQARLAMEEKYQFGQDPESDPANLSPARHEALVRNYFFCNLQSFILQHAMRF